MVVLPKTVRFVVVAFVAEREPNEPKGEEREVEKVPVSADSVWRLEMFVGTEGTV